LKSSRSYYRESRDKVIEALGGVCVACGHPDRRALQIDHVEGGGGNELRRLTYNAYHTKVLASIEAGERRYQLLCANCNWIKRAEKNENPYAR